MTIAKFLPPWLSPLRIFVPLTLLFNYFVLQKTIQICFFSFTVITMDLNPTFQYIFSILDKIPTHY